MSSLKKLLLSRGMSLLLFTPAGIVLPTRGSIVATSQGFMKLESSVILGFKVFSVWFLPNWGLSIVNGHGHLRRTSSGCFYFSYKMKSSALNKKIALIKIQSN
ncbi:hypothetical protein GDO78_017769 [Eleutherodactylus coqui]|uniref:Uncharacterized protein n=1 Tax=Eleutherodactylus coqui TaxID=57060 RepID=A0A8J6BD97_ELECQ|nr:hypothetical protein GDO78_017769 [Eleutherodactylus coqui]